MINTEKQILAKAPALDLNRIVMILYRRWYFILGAILISLLIAHLKLRYSSPIYLASLTFKLEDEKPNQISDFLKFSRGTTGKLDNFLKTESEILRSRTLAQKALEAIDYRVIYTQKGQIISTELYPNTIFRLDIVHLDSSCIGKTYEVAFTSATTFEINEFEIPSSRMTAKVNDTIFYDRSFFRIIPLNPKSIARHMGEVTECTINDIFTLAGDYASNLDVEIIKGTSVLNIAFTSGVPKLAADYLNTIAEVYIQETVNNKSLAAQQTVDFIEGLLLEMSNKVKKSEFDLTDFRVQNNAIDLEVEAKSELERVTSLETEKSILELQGALLDKLEKSLTDIKGRPVAFVALDKEDASNLSDLVTMLNALIIDRISLVSKYAPSSPLLIENEKKINEVKSGLNRVITSTKEKNKARINFNQQLIDEINENINVLPIKQRMLLNIQREFKVNEKVYAYLLEKRLETMISKSAITSNGMIIDTALPPYYPIFPNASRTYLVFFLGGLSIGLGLILLTRILYQKIPDKETIESISATPVIGLIKRVSVKDEEPNASYDVYVFKSPKSIFAESVRGIRTNINFILKGQKHKSICITSTVSGEGKTFCTINLAASFTMLNHKVVIVGCDLRRPKLHLSFQGIHNDIGLTTFLIGKSTMEEIILPTEYPNLYIIPAGPTPPNPAELLQTDDMVKLCADLKERFDYVMYDTAPVGLVSDSFPLLKSSDMSLYIFRSDYSKREFGLIPDRLKADNDIPNLYSILNSYDTSSMIYSSIYRSEYGGYYGGGGHYYYGGYYGGSGYYGKRYYSQYYSGYYADEENDHKPWWKFWGSKSRKK